MAYSEQVWYDAQSGGTPITAARLNHMEDGIAEANDAVDSMSPVYGTGTMNGGWSINAFTLVRRGNLVRLDLNVSFSAASTLGGVYGTVPAGFRPSITTIEFPAVYIGSTYTSGTAYVNPDGGLYLRCTTPVQGVRLQAFWEV